MCIQGARNKASLRLLWCLGMMIPEGCGVTPVAPDVSDVRSTLNLSSLDFDGFGTHYESSPNDVFDLADLVATTAQARLIQGYVTGPDDVDVFDLGPVTPGDRVVVTMTAAESLDGAVALFDSDGTALLVNDHRNVYLGRAEPFIDLVVRRPSQSCYVAVSATPGFASAGEYQLEAIKEAAGDPPDPRPDVVLLVFNGGYNVRIGGRPAVDVAPFDAANISGFYAGQTGTMLRGIVARVREDYAAFDVEIRSTSEGDAFEPGMSRIFFGTYDPALLGVAEGVDEYNAIEGQQAIVFTDTFSAFMPLRPTVSDMSQAIANVTSHEIGHLLGMIHTADPSGIMDVTASLTELLRDQVFTRSPIFSAVFPIGYQDAVQYLLDSVGGDAALAEMQRPGARAKALAMRRTADAVPARLSARLSTCSLGGG